eukprot:Skav202710  [mRNA]  locus=scaffold654:644734:649143:+ [translate_table: standard]
MHEACTVDSTPASALWPVPPVRWRWTDCRRLCPRRRRRLKLLRAHHELLNVVICALNWETLGFPAEAPSHARLGASISMQQHQVIERKEGMLWHYLQVPSFDGDDLGRAYEKFAKVISNVKELPLCKLGFEDLTELASAIHSGFDPYSSHFSGCSSAGKPTVVPDGHQCDHSFRANPDGNAKTLLTGSLPVVSDRVKWKYPPSFAAEHFLDDPLLKAAYVTPEVLRKPPQEWKSKRPAKVQCDRTEFLKLAKRWDALGACKLVLADNVSFDEAVGLFCVPKDSDFDWLIVNPQVIDGRMYTLSRPTKELAPGCLLSMLHLNPDEMFRISADDLSDFYYTFKVSHARALRNTFRIRLHSHEVQDFHCYHKEFEGKTLMLSLCTLAMGDNLAVEVAQTAHGSILRSLVGSMRSEEVLRYRHPTPRSSFVELLAIDDHVGIQKLKKRDYSKNPKLRDTAVFDQASKAYSHVKLVLQEKKRKRNMTQSTILGADFDGVEGKVMAPRPRIMMLSLLTVAIALKGTCTPKLLATILGCWVHVLLFRRALFSIIDNLFRQGTGFGQHEPFCLSAQSKNELLLLSALGPTAQSNLRAKYSDKIYATDASPQWGAVCQADLDPNAAAELWRHSEQRGYYTRLQSAAAAVLQEIGVPPDSDMQFAHQAYDISDSPPPQYIPDSLQEGYLYDVCEVFRGTGNWTSVHASRGLKPHDGFDVDGRRLRCGDVADPKIFHELIALAARKVVREWHAGVPCVSFGTLRRPQVRSKDCPYGFNPDEPFTKFHNMLARRTAFVLTVAVLMGQFISVEQPRGSRLFLLHCFRTLVKLGCVISHFASCAFGSACQKASKWLHNKPWMLPLECSCTCKPGGHFVVQGTFTKESLAEFKRKCRPSCMEVYGCEPSLGTSVASFSAAYPLRLVERMASGSLDARDGRVEAIPLRYKLRSLLEVGEPAAGNPPNLQSETPFAARPWYENPEWHADLCQSLQFREVFKYKFKVPGHINVNEVRTYKSWLKSLAKTNPDERTIGLLDSRVTIGAAAKGRSSSYSISRVLKGSLAYVIGSGLYPGLLHCYSGDNPSDDPTRGRAVRKPCREKPQWLIDLEAGQTARFDAVVASGRLEKIPARWLRLLLLLGGDIERNPGPRAPRGPLDLSTGFAPATALRMEKCLALFRSWCEGELSCSWSDLVSDSDALILALRCYGLHCFESGLPRYQFVYAITAVQDQWPQLRPFLSMVWQVDKKWQIHEPGMCRSVLPPNVIRAAVCLACIWGWYLWAGLVLLGFSAMLHPSEMLCLCRRDLIFPDDVAMDTKSMYIRVRDPKTARFARRQHSRVDDEGVIQIAVSLYSEFGKDDRLYPASMSVFRRQWNAVMSRLGIPHSQTDQGATPGVLRGSGATYLYQQTEDLTWVAWRGRWSRLRTLEYYLQEVGAFVLVHSLEESSKARIAVLAEFSWPVLCETILSLRSSDGRDGRAYATKRQM